jgi:hypothetical protein
VIGFARKADAQLARPSAEEVVERLSLITVRAGPGICREE